MFGQLEILQRCDFGDFHTRLLRAFGKERDANVSVFRISEDRQATEVHNANNGSMSLERTTKWFAVSCA